MSMMIIVASLLLLAASVQVGAQVNDPFWWSKARTGGLAGSPASTTLLIAGMWRS